MAFIKKHETACITILVCICLFLFVRSQINQTKNDGIYTVAKVIKYEAAESGSDFHIDIYLDGKTYSTTVDQRCQSSCVGNYFFVKVRRDDPTVYPIFYGTKQVPDCIIQNVKSFKGWRSIPTVIITETLL